MLAQQLAVGDARPGPHRRQGSDVVGAQLQGPGDGLAGLALAPVGEQEAGRLGDDPNPDQQEDRDGPQRDEAAPVVVQEPLRHRAQEEPQRDEHRAQSGQQTALPGGHELLDVGDGDDVEAPDAHSDQHPQQGQHHPPAGGGEHRGQGEDGEEQDAPEEGASSAHPVGGPAPQDRAEHCAQPGAGQDDTGLEAAQAPLLLKLDDGEADEEHVEELRDVGDNRQSDDASLMARQGPGVDLLQSAAVLHRRRRAPSCCTHMRPNLRARAPACGNKPPSVRDTRAHACTCPPPRKREGSPLMPARGCTAMHHRHGARGREQDAPSCTRSPQL